MNTSAHRWATRSALVATLSALAAGCGGGADGPGDAGEHPGAHEDGGRGKRKDAGGGGSPVGCAVIRTNGGPVQGTTSGSACAYEGIPFAAPPVAALRWMAPAPPKRWKTPRPSALPPWCPQVGVSTNEDCLYLNVWTPTRRPRVAAPVMVFVHGGGFTSGSGADPLYDGTHLAEATGNLVVTINYRLGALGFLSMAALPGDDPTHGSTGNYGILDQIAAFQWVHDNIVSFGGDPANVTIFGESAGGTSMLVHLVSPSSRGLFSRMIIESAATGANFPAALPQSTADALGASFAVWAGCTDSSTALSCLRGAPIDTILGGASANGLPSVGGSHWLPVVDGYVIPSDPVQAITAGSFNKVPTLIGNNRDEGTLLLYNLGNLPTDPASYLAFEEAQTPGHGAAIVAEYPVTSYQGSYFAAASAVLTDSMFLCPARRVGRAIAATGTPTFRYDFVHAVPRPELELGAFHTSELLFVFGNEFCWFGPCVSLQQSEMPLSRSMMGYWGRIAKTGDPNGGGRYEWPKYDRGTETELVLDLWPSTEKELEKAQCDFWDGLAP